jgi:hypothetical protein
VFRAPFDDMKQPLELEPAVKFTKLNFAMGDDVANAPRRPTWSPGDFLGELFARAHASR